MAGGGGETCAIKAHDFLTAHYRLKPEQLLSFTMAQRYEA